MVCFYIGTFIIFNDKSVSRSHAKIIIGEQNSRDAVSIEYSVLRNVLKKDK